jgi:hypothetical protein
MINDPATRLSFRVHFIRMDGPERDPPIRVLLVETYAGQTIYEGFGTWSQCSQWVVQFSECSILGDQLAAIRKRVEMKRLATIKEVQVSLGTLGSMGFRRANGYAGL